MPSRGISSRRATDLVVVAIIYATVLAASFAFVAGKLNDSDGIPDVTSGATAALLAITPTVLLVILIVKAYQFIREYRLKAWGYRLRARVILSFLMVSGMAAVPPTLFMGILAIKAVEMPTAFIIRSALENSIESTLSYYAEKEATLRFIAENDVATAIASRGSDAVRVLARLSAREPSICAVELFSNGKPIGFAGDESTRSEAGSTLMDRNGFLPRLAVEGRGYARYFDSDVGSGSDGQRLSAVVAMQFSEQVEDTAVLMSEAMATMASSEQVARSFSLYLVFFSFSLSFPFLALTALFGMAATDRLLRPVAALSDAVARVSAGARRAPFLAKPGDEAGDLVEAFNAVLEGLERSRGDELRNEKIGAWRDIARKLAHELRNPLTPIRLSAERVLRRWKATPASIEEILEKSMVAIVQETINMENLLTEFRDFARLPEPQKDWVELKSMIEEAVHLYSASWPELAIECVEIDGNIILKADRGYLKQALGNLISNAADATEKRGHIWIRADLVKTAESRYCRIQVRDNGHGIPPDVQDKVFTPYFTTKPGGTGLGLAIVEHIVSAHGGKIRFDSSEGAGTVFYIDIPSESA
jgi:nitrogen fixation/metabolism regulation signal transduction histidine kinase